MDSTAEREGAFQQELGFMFANSVVAEMERYLLHSVVFTQFYKPSC